MAGGENCAWAKMLFELSSSMRVRRKATLIVSEGSTRPYDNIFRCADKLSGQTVS